MGVRHSVNQNSGARYWQRTDSITTYNAFGQPLEILDALNHASGTYYGHGHTMTEAAAINAGYAEIGYDGFEEYLYYFHRYRERDSEVCMLPGHFMFQNPVDFLDAGVSRSTTIEPFLDKNQSHTGQYSLKINDTPVRIEKRISASPTARGQRNTRTNGNTFLVSIEDRIKPFEPKLGKYIISAWVHEDDLLFNKITFAHPRITVRLGARTEVFTASGPNHRWLATDLRRVFHRPCKYEYCHRYNELRRQRATRRPQSTALRKHHADLCL